MSFIAPYAFTGALSLYLGYKTYNSYYSNCEFEELGIETKDDEIQKVAKELIDSIIDEVVANIEKENDLEADEASKDVDAPEDVDANNGVNSIENPIKREDIEINNIKNNKIIEEVKREENVELTNYDNMVNVVNKTLDKLEGTKKDSKIEEHIVVVEMKTNNENVVEEVVKSPIQKSRNQNNLKKRKKRKNKK